MSPKEALEESLDLNFDKVKKAFGNSNDIITQTILLNGADPIQIGVIYINGLISPSSIQTILTENLKVDSSEFPFNALRNALSILGQVREITDFETLYQSILSGLTVILMNGYVQGFAANTQGGEYRSVEEPTTQSVVRGPREGFTEQISTNICTYQTKNKRSQLMVGIHDNRSCEQNGSRHHVFEWNCE